MEPFYDAGLTVTHWLQTHYPQLSGLMLFLADLVRFEVFLAILPLVYWCVNKQAGKNLAYLVIFADFALAASKHLLRGPRPYWLDASLGLDVDPEYGLPSGHTLFSTLTAIFVAYRVRRPIGWLLAGLFIVLMALSRVYLGMHFLHDVAGGFLVGVCVFLAFVWWERNGRDRFSNRILGQRLLLVLLVPLVGGVIYAVGLLLVGEPAAAVSWSALTDGAELAGYENAFRGLGLLTGAGSGFILEVSRVRFMVTGPWWKRIARYLIGIVVTIFLWQGLGALFPDEPLPLALPLRFVRYFILGQWVAYYAPWVFVKLQLADAAAEPEVSLSVTQNGILRG